MPGKKSDYYERANRSPLTGTPSGRLWGYTKQPTPKNQDTLSDIREGVATARSEKDDAALQKFVGGVKKMNYYREDDGK